MACCAAVFARDHVGDVQLHRNFASFWKLRWNNRESSTIGAERGTPDCPGGDSWRLSWQRPHRVLESYVSVAPRSDQRTVDESRAAPATASLRHLDRALVMRSGSARSFCGRPQSGRSLGLLFVKDLEGGFAHVEDQCTTLIFRPHMGRFEAEPVTIETRQSVKGLGR
jgi:hypothetical protein